MEIFLGLIVLVVIGYLVDQNKTKRPYYKRPYSENKNYSDQRSEKLEQGNDQLTLAMRGGYSKQQLLNKSEQIIFKIIRRELGNKPFHCFPQVSCGEFLRHDDTDTFLITVNSKRVDFCIFDYQFNPVAVIEYLM